MSPLGKLWALYPAALLAAAASCVGWMLVEREPWACLALFGVLYLAPPLTYLLHQKLWPLRNGGTKLVGPDYVPWWGTYQIQLLYIAVPQLEALLRCVPGLYSAWLRLWGSRVGKRVQWTPLVDITDRGLLDVGDDVVFGHRSSLFRHVIRPTRDGNLLLFVRPVVVGRGAFVGAGSALGPGVVVQAGAVLKAQTVVTVAREVA